MICLKSPKSKKILLFFLTNNGQKSVTKFISLCCNNYLIEFLEIGKLKKKSTPPKAFEPAIYISLGLSYGTPVQ